MFTETLTFDLDRARVSERQKSYHTLHLTVDIGGLWSGPTWGRGCRSCGKGSCSCSSDGSSCERCWILGHSRVRFRVKMMVLGIIGIMVVVTNSVRIR